MKKVATFLSFVLVVGVVLQVAWAEIPFVHHRSPAPLQLPAAATITTPWTDYVQTHVPRGQTILFVTDAQGTASPAPYFLLSTALVDRNQVWWAAPARVTNLTQWWYDVSSGAPAIRALAVRFGARYVVFDNLPMPAGLPVVAVWRQSAGLAVVELAEKGGG